MRLIDADCLKELINYNQNYVNPKLNVFNVLRIIDNAPTVERPQGEWGKWIIAEVQCSNCFKYFEVDYYSAEELNKCPNCGADMRGGAE